MERTKFASNLTDENIKTTSTEGLCQMLGCGRVTAVKVGKAAGGEVRIGRKLLWNVDKVSDYVDKISV